ncbi:MAG TPA: carbon-nitrogen hydrolase family protein [Nocardioidaceae bacterium]|nr:carbon-nitrogen hydrolase family protein [Nocardioidaceae bacterium]
MPALTIAVVQVASSLDPAENRETLGVVADLCAREPKPDLVVFPEVMMRDFGKSGSDVSDFAEDLDGPFVQRLTDLAKAHDVTIVAGMFERSDDPARPYNTLAVVDRGGLRASYRKIHLYDSFGYKESERLLAGAVEPVVVEVGGFQVGLMTCYDLRFPELARALVDRGAELLVVPAAWVAGPGKVDHWRTLLKARAIENTVYVAAAGQPGPRYTGHSMVVSPRGEVVEAGGDDLVVQSTIERGYLEEVRAENPSLANRRFRP